MDKKLAKLMEPGFKVIFSLLLIFVAVTCYFSVPAAIVEGLLVAVAFLFYKRGLRKRRREIRRYVETLAFQADNASKSTMVNFPLPVVIMRLDTGEVVWENEGFESMVGGPISYDAHITEIVPGFDTRWLMENKPCCPFDVQVGERKYNVYGNLVMEPGDSAVGILATLFWVDITEFSELREKYRRTRPVVGIFLIDSHEELFKNISESEQSIITAEIDSRLSGWFKNTGGVFRKMERGRYLTVFESGALLEMIADKFSIVESMHEVKNSEGIPATLSIGIGKGEELSLAELYSSANLSIDMALSRGGDQVIIKSPTGFEFYGGQSKEIEKRTKVKSRVMANALRQLIEDSSQVFVMGHRVSDLDSVGAAAGIVAAVRKLGKPVSLVCNKEVTSARELIDRLEKAPEYSGVFVTEDEAMMRCDARSLLVVVDTSRPDIVESPALLETIQRVAVVDHHRRAASYIEKMAINMHEPYASSASELVTELLQYIISPQELLKCEAEALLAGIVLDTKSFTVKTGVRTFEAAAYLKQIGADTVDVRKMFSGNLEGYIKRYQLISEAKHIFPGISLVVSHQPVDRAVASQAVDELINISDVSAAFVVFAEANGGCAVSGRSYGQINVQYVLEKIGGGGSMNMAGAQFADRSVDNVVSLLTDAVAEYLNETKKEEKPQ